MALSLFAGCTGVAYIDAPPSYPVYYGSYGGYYGPYYWGPSGVIVHGVPHGWHGNYYRGNHYYGPLRGG